MAGSKDWSLIGGIYTIPRIFPRIVHHISPGIETSGNKKDRWDSRKSHPPTNYIITLCELLINITLLLAYVLCTDLLKIWVTLTLTFQGHLRSNLTVPLDSSHMVSHSRLIVTWA